MIRFRTSILAAVLGFAALASSPARADFVIYGGANYGTVSFLNDVCTGPGTTCNGGPYNYINTNINGFEASLTLTGYDTLGAHGGYFDDSNFDLQSMGGTTSLTLETTETNLNTSTGLTAVEFLSSFTGHFVTGAMDLTAAFYLNTNNANFDTHGVSDLLASFTCNGVSGTCSSYNSGKIASALYGVSGAFSITEEIDITNATSGSSLSSDDSLTVPEPMSLTLFGSGLLALGALSRRRRKAAKSA